MLALVLALMAVSGGTAYAEKAPEPPPAPGFTEALHPFVSATLTPSGGGEVTAYGFGGTKPPTWTPAWQICNAAGEACGPYGLGDRIDVGGSPAGSRFKALGADGTTFALSPVWNGALALRTGPRARGAVRANRLITPLPAVWNGGWADDGAETQLSACPTAGATGCITLAESRESPCAGAAAIDPDFTGWYLRVASGVYGPDNSFAVAGGADEHAEHAWQTGPTSAVAVLGRVARATGRRTSSCGPTLVPGLPPREALNVRYAEIETDGLAIVSCSTFCPVAERAAAGGRQAVAKAGGTGEIELRIPGPALARLGHGRIRYMLSVYGHPVARSVITR